jgi:hypothetical protein
MMLHFCSRLTGNSETPHVSRPPSGLSWRFFRFDNLNFPATVITAPHFRVPPAFISFLLTLTIEERIPGSGSGVNMHFARKVGGDTDEFKSSPSFGNRHMIPCVERK